jgi:DNA-binding response OmpR family regulator
MTDELSRRHAHVVHGDARVRAFAAHLLRRSGFEVSDADNGAATERILANRVLLGLGAPTVLVAGIRLRGYNGLELLSGLRASEWAAPMILIGRPEDGPLLSVAERIGAHAVLRWPFSPDAFLMTVRDLGIERARRHSGIIAVPAAREMSAFQQGRVA